MKFYMKLILSIFITSFVYIFVNSSIKNIMTSIQIKNFKDSCTLDEINSTSSAEYYTVSRETQPGMYNNNGYILPGSSCDIMINLTSSFDFPIVHEIASFTIGGHAALAAFDYSDSFYDITNKDDIETAYNEEQKETFVDTKEYWNNLLYTDSFIVLRVDLTEYQKRVVFNEAVSMLGDPYNLSFFFNTKESHYCTDLITKAFNSVGINLNSDGFLTTTYDLITSKYTQIVGYKEYDKVNEISRYYYVN